MIPKNRAPTLGLSLPHPWSHKTFVIYTVKRRPIASNGHQKFLVTTTRPTDPNMIKIRQPFLANSTAGKITTSISTPPTEKVKPKADHAEMDMI